MPTPMQAIQQALDMAQAGRVGPAVASLERLTQKRGAPPEAHHFLGMLLARQGRFDQALEQLERASRMAPGRAQFEANHASVLAQAGRAEEALRRYREAAVADPGYGHARVGMGSALLNLGRLVEAEAEAREGWRLSPTNIEAALNLASVLLLTGRAHDAVDLLRGAIGSLGPSIAANTLLAAALDYDSRATPEVILQAHRTLGGLHGAAVRGAAPGLPALKTIDPGAGRVRVGFLSADFRDHPVGMFIEPALRPDPERSPTVEVFCYDRTARRDGFSERLRAGGAVWRDVAQASDTALVSAVRGDGIDVLIELSGHSIGNRQTALAARMAPVQVSYLGYPATTGNPSIDARFVDSRSDPEGSDRWCTERLVRLDPCAWCFSPPADGPEVGGPPCGDSGPVTFGSFNNLAKTVPAVLDVWARVLSRVPGSRLILKNSSFVDKATRERFAEHLVARGVPRDRLEMLAPTGSTLDHLRAYRRVDIALDTFPYAGTTTTCEALWMGVPVVTLAGRLHAGRVGVSLLGVLGLDDLVAPDEAAYVDAATGLAEERARLADLRRTLRDRVLGSALTDAPGFRRRFHDACVALVREKGAAG